MRLPSLPSSLLGLTLPLLLPLAAGGCGPGATAKVQPSAAPEVEPAATGEPEPSEPLAPPGTDAGKDASLPADGTAGCGKAPPSLGAADGVALTVGATTRTYTIALPEGYDPTRAYRLVFGFHSGGRNGAGTRPYYDLESRAGNSAIFVYPDGLKGSWDLETPAEKNRDVAFFDALVATISASHCIDRTRIFAMGTSMGAYLTNQLGCRRGNTLRAIATHAGGGPFELQGSYDAQGTLVCPERPVAAAIFHGLSDTNVAPSEGDKSIKHWRTVNHCKSSSSPRSPSPCEAPDGCDRPVLICKIPGQGHAIWASGRQATWDFFAGF